MRDSQDVDPLCFCVKCGNEIFAPDPVAPIDGSLIHEQCMTKKQQAKYPTYPAGSFFNEAC